MQERASPRAAALVVPKTSNVTIRSMHALPMVSEALLYVLPISTGRELLGLLLQAERGCWSSRTPYAVLVA
jgi:hypothetical protein